MVIIPTQRVLPCALIKMHLRSHLLGVFLSRDDVFSELEEIKRVDPIKRTKKKNKKTTGRGDYDREFSNVHPFLCSVYFCLSPAGIHVVRMFPCGSDDVRSCSNGSHGEDDSLLLQTLQDMNTHHRLFPFWFIFVYPFKQFILILLLLI